MIFLSLGILSFVVKNIVTVPFIRSALGLVFPMHVQSLPNLFARERVQVGTSGPATSLFIFPCFPEPSVKCCGEAARLHRWSMWCW